jgi:exonuclease III
VDSSFYDVDSFINSFKNSTRPVFISVNIQSLNAKFEKLLEITNRFLSSKLPIEVLALQETWSIKYANLLELPGFQKLIYKNRTVGKGGGVGFYVKNGLSVKQIEPPFRYFTNKIFESLTLEITDSSSKNNRQYIVSNVYRSPTLIRGYTLANQIAEFSNTLEQLLSFLNSSKKKSYVFMDANINLLSISNSDLAMTHLETIHNNGFIMSNLKATRMFNDTCSLIDHILCNDNSNKIYSGSIVDDLSDHFMTFIQPDLCPNSKKTK